MYRCLNGTSPINHYSNNINVSTIVSGGSKILYFNTTSRGFPTGIHVGRDSTNRVLTVDSNLAMLTYRQIPYKLQAIEVWGCGAKALR